MLRFVYVKYNERIERIPTYEQPCSYCVHRSAALSYRYVVVVGSKQNIFFLTLSIFKIFYGRNNVKHIQIIDPYFNFGIIIILKKIINYIVYK